MNKIDEELLINKYGSLEAIKDKLDNNYPIQYLIGYVDFYGYRINVDERALIPRFETEGLIELVINTINKHNIKINDIFDIGTGSGCIDVVLSKKLNNANISTIDISSDALSLAKENYTLNNVDNIEVINNDIFEYNPTKKYDLIISNPPYVAYDEEVDKETKYEPQNAIFADNKGLVFYEHIIKESVNWINAQSIIAFEIGYNQGDYLKEYAANYYPNSIIEIHKDLSNRDRYLLIISK
jgi:release factor glutamine methyltransferase